LSVARLHDLRAHDRGTRDGSGGVVVAATQRDCDKRGRKTTGTPQFGFAGSLIDYRVVRSMMFHNKSIR
jgi:hypothetical protein